MMMNETVILVLAGSAGLLLGAIFFGGLWWTVRKGLSSKRPALCFWQPGAANEHVTWLASMLSPAVIGSGCWRVCSDSSSRASS
jgi:hypothetical protein